MNTGKPSRPRTMIGQREPELNPVIELGPAIKARIGEQLRLIYEEVVDQGVPDRFVEILRGLDPPTDGGSKNGPS
jgi:anti-sigma factor NepR-like protein